MTKLKRDLHRQASDLVDALEQTLADLGLASSRRTVKILLAFVAAVYAVALVRMVVR